MKVFKSMLAVAALALLACGCDKGENPWLDSTPVEKPAAPEYDVWPEPVEIPLGKASGYLYTLNEAPSGDLSKYYITIYAPGVTPAADNWTAKFEALNAPGLTMDNLTGEYTIQGSPADPFLMDNGWSFDGSAWGMGIMEGGTMYIDGAGKKQYVTAGKINITVAKTAAGDLIYSLIGSDIKAKAADDPAATPVDASLKFKGACDKPLESEIVIGQPSGYTCVIAGSAAASTAEGPVEGLTKYYLHIYAPGIEPDGASHCCELQVVNDDGLALENLAGDYTAASYPAKKFLMDNGYIMDLSAWGMGIMAGGSFFTDESGTKQYIDANGVVSITSAEDADGNPLFSFSAKDIKVTSLDSGAGTGSFEIKFASLAALPNAE